ncbi:unnamed protein product [Albugo candida]|uniref:Uncharacterized protein n=1 Tax=Albugo candida TaxID=65357 RepID=A0A024GJ44_9STRA|nr:unnamed protein product [Albugo candida]|eukprot:CCI46731.1 unnamed protein product [Albugo candida]
MELISGALPTLFAAALRNEPKRTVVAMKLFDTCSFEKPEDIMRTGRGIKQASLAVFVLCPFRCNIIKRKLEMKLVLLIGRLMIYIVVNAGIVNRLRFSFLKLPQKGNSA